MIHLIQNLLLLCVASLCMTLSSAQSVPSIACPNYFQYLRLGNQNIGKITLPNAYQGTIKVDVQFMQRIPVQSNNYGRLSLYYDQQTTLNSLQNGQPILYRVDFPLANEFPKLTRISVNGGTICSASGYPAPSTTLNLQHTLHTTTTTTYVNSNTRPQQNTAPVFHFFDRFGDGYDTDIITNQVTYTTRPQQTQYGNNPFMQNVIHRFIDGHGQQQTTYTRPQVQQQTTYTRPQVQQQPTYTRPQVQQQTIYSRPQVQTQQPQYVPASPQGQVAQRQPELQPQPQPQPQQQPQLQPQPQPRPPQQTQFQQVPQSLDAQCGQEGRSGFSPFIYGGSVLTRGQFPWLTAVYRKQSSGLKFLCGGSLVSSRTVVTAAHCFRLTSLTAEQVVVYLGRHNLENYSEEGVLTSEVQRLIMHPDYNTNSVSDADIAVLQLQAPVSFTPNIRPICLWNEPTDTNLIVGQEGIVAGWGSDENGREVSALPKMVGANIVSEGDCLRSLEGYKALTSPRTLCAGNRDGTGPCMGDSGSGLMVKRNGRWMLRGIVSVGQTKQQQCNLQEYVVYCDVAQHLSWLRTNTI